MSRVPLLALDEAPLTARVWYREDGGASALTRSLASAPDLLETLMPFLGHVMGESSLDLATKELVIVRVSELTILAGAIGMLNSYCIAFEIPPPS